MKIERLSLFNYRALKEMSLKSSKFNNINNNVFKLLKALKLKDKILIKRNIYLLKDEKQYYGYLWLQHLCSDMYIINDLYFMDYRTDSFDDFCEGKTLLYETMINSDCNKFLPSYNFKINDISDVLRLQLNTLFTSEDNDDTFETFIKNKHEDIRCELQNNIFDADTRVPITKDDIYFDEEQEYYIDDGLIFMKDNDNFIGMGQIINLKGKLTIVNFGIRREYRNNGYARKLLSKLIEKARNLSLFLNQRYIYLRVSRSNETAYNIYSDAGFQYYDSVITWER